MLLLIIDEAQSPFVKGRNIGDNIKMAKEHFHGYYIAIWSPRMAIKVDLIKAYDHIRWKLI